MAAEQLDLALPWVALLDPALPWAAVRREPEPALAWVAEAAPAWAAEEAAEAAGDITAKKGSLFGSLFLFYFSLKLTGGFQEAKQKPAYIPSFTDYARIVRTQHIPLAHGLRMHGLDLRPP